MVGDNGEALTFTDQLGDFMEVKDFNAIVFGKDENSTQKYEKTGKTTDGNTDTYIFKHVVDAIHAEGATVNEGEESTNLDTLSIKVTRSSNLREGDLIEVTVPPQLVPLVEYSIKAEEGAAGWCRRWSCG